LSWVTFMLARQTDGAAVQLPPKQAVIQRFGAPTLLFQ